MKYFNNYIGEYVEMDEFKTVKETIEEVCQDICDNFCKFRDDVGDEDFSCQHFDDCPLNRLY